MTDTYLGLTEIMDSKEQVTKLDFRTDGNCKIRSSRVGDFFFQVVLYLFVRKWYELSLQARIFAI